MPRTVPSPAITQVVDNLWSSAVSSRATNKTACARTPVNPCSGPQTAEVWSTRSSRRKVTSLAVKIWQRAPIWATKKSKRSEIFQREANSMPRSYISRTPSKTGERRSWQNPGVNGARRNLSGSSVCWTICKKSTCRSKSKVTPSISWFNRKTWPD